MSFEKLALQRHSCRSFDASRSVEEEKLTSILNTAILSPSACNAQPYHFTVCKGEVAHRVAAATQGMGMNKFTSSAPVMIVISEASYNASAAMGAKIKNNDYRSIDIGIAVAYLTAAAEDLGLGSCILGWLDAKKIKELCSLDGTPRLVVALGYASVGSEVQPKKRKSKEELVTLLGEEDNG